MNKIILDMSICYIFANASKFVEIINAYSNENYKIQIIKKNYYWKNYKNVGTRDARRFKSLFRTKG